jgi:preprotein translocase subunit SecA
LRSRLEAEAGFFAERDEVWLAAYAETLRGQLVRDADLGVDLMARALAMVARLSELVVGRRSSADELLVAAAVLGGRIVEHDADCDRGTSLSLAAAVAALGGVRVHIVCAREPRAGELGERFAKLYECLGLRSSALSQRDSLEIRRRAWNSDVVFVGVAALMDEFLKDRRSVAGEGGRVSRLVSRLTGGAGAVSLMRLRGLELALLDDASGLLCDFATRPFVVRDREGMEEELRALALSSRLADELTEGDDYRLDASAGRAELTAQGEARLDSIGGIVSGPLSRPLARRRLVEGALLAHRLFDRDRHYEVVDGRVEFKTEGGCIVGTERAPDEELRARIAVKEGLPPTQKPRAGVHTTLGRALKRYLALGGATASADGLVAEIAREFELSVVRLGARPRGSRRTHQLHADREGRDTWIREELASLNAAGEGVWVLCSTPESVAAVQELGVQAGLEFTEWDGAAADPRNSYVLCAQIGHEQPFGEDGAVVGPPLALVVDCLDALHVERQLLARLQATHVRYIVSVEDQLVGKVLHERAVDALRWIAGRWQGLDSFLAKRLTRFVHTRAEAARRKARRAYATAEEEEHKQLTFTGPPPA